MSDRRKSGNRVVSVGANANRLALRHAVLELAGYEVWSTTNLSLALTFVRHERCGVLLLHYSLPEACRKLLISAFRTSCPGGLVIGIANGPSAWSPGDLDATIFEADGIEALLKVLSGEDEREAA